MNLECFWTLFDAQPLTREHFECLGDDLAQRKHLCFSPAAPGSILGISDTQDQHCLVSGQ